MKGKSDVVGEIRTGFLAVFLTSFNFSSPGCDFKNKLRIAICKMPVGESLGVGSSGDIQYWPCSFAVLNAGDLKPLPEALCFGDVITAGDDQLDCFCFPFSGHLAVRTEQI